MEAVLMKKKVAIFCGGPSSEYEVSLNSARTIFEHLDKEKYEVSICYISKELHAKLVRNGKTNFEKSKTKTPLLKVLQKIKDEGFYALLAGIHGEFAEDGHLQSLLEFYKIPYSGSDIYGSTLAMDKYRSSLIVEKIPGLKMPVSVLILSNKNFNNTNLHYPLIIKPNTLGSSVGVFIVKDKNESNNALKVLKDKLKLREYIVQECLIGAIELSCGVLQKNNGEFVKLPPIEIRPKRSPFFDYNAKYQIGGSVEITPPKSVSKALSDKISELACDIHTCLGLRTYSRSDFLVKDNNIYYLETNTLPGMTTTSLLPQEAKAIGMSFEKLLDFLITNT